MASREPDKLVLLLVGRTGNGKSSTGNSILLGLEKKAFTPRGSTAAIQPEIKKGEAVVNEQLITVVDGPGVGDASFDNYEEMQQTLDQVDEAFNLSPDGFSALLIVLKYGIRFTQQEKDAITMIKAIFGSDVVRKYGVIVMSHGDSFELDTEDEEMSFEDWCKEQTGDVKALFTECENRCVLFNNRTKDQDTVKAQYDTLMSKVKSIRLQNTNYTPHQYGSANAKKERRQLIVRSKLPQMEKETEDDLDKITNQLNQLNNDNREESLELLNHCKVTLEKRRSELQKHDEETGCTQDLQKRVELVETTVQIKLRRLQAPTSENKENVNKNESASSGGTSVFSGWKRKLGIPENVTFSHVTGYFRDFFAEKLPTDKQSKTNNEDKKADLKKVDQNAASIDKERKD